jgi:hypothetical protein
MLTPGPRTVTGALRVMGLALERHVTTDHRVLNRATWSACPGSRMLLGVLITLLVPPGATRVFGADETVERRSGRKITAKGCDREAGRSTKKPVSRCFGLTWVSMMRLVPVPWSRRVWVFPFLTARCWPETKRGTRRQKTRVDGVRQLMQQVRRWLPGRRLVVVVDGGVAAVLLALAGVKSRVVMGSRLRWDAARYHPPGVQPPGKRGPKPTQGKRQRRLQRGTERSDTPWEDVEVDWYGGHRQKLWVFSRTALWYTPRLPPVAIRYVVGADPEGNLRIEAFFCPDRQATPEQILAWVVRRWSVEVTLEEARAHLGLETPRQWLDQAMARTTPVLLALFSLVTMLALKLSSGGQIPVPATAWYHQAEPTFAACLALVRRHLWRACYLVHSTPEGECIQFPHAALDLLIHGVPLAA